MVGDRLGDERAVAEIRIGSPEAIACTSGPAGSGEASASRHARPSAFEVDVLDGVAARALGGGGGSCVALLLAAESQANRGLD